MQRYRRKDGSIKWGDPKIAQKVIEDQRVNLWTDEQISSFAKHFKLRPGIKLLDVGCGHGYLLRKFGQFALPKGKLFGLDKEQKLLEKAKTLSEKEGLGKVSSFKKGSIYKLDYKDNYFDVTMAQLVFCHLKRPDYALKEIIRVTKKGGCIAIFDYLVNVYDDYWDSIHTDKLSDIVLDIENLYRMKRGRKKLGRSNYEIGYHLPSLMIKRGLININARCNENVTWLHSPYNTDGQQHTLKRIKHKLENEMSLSQDTLEVLSAGGASKENIEKLKKHYNKKMKKIRNMINDKTYQLFAPMGALTCIWGFKGK